MPDDLVEGIDYYMENGFMVFTAVYLLTAWVLLRIGMQALSVRVRTQEWRRTGF